MPVAVNQSNRSLKPGGGGIMIIFPLAYTDKLKRPRTATLTLLSFTRSCGCFHRLYATSNAAGGHVSQSSVPQSSGGRGVFVTLCLGAFSRHVNSAYMHSSVVAYSVHHRNPSQTYPADPSLFCVLFLPATATWIVPGARVPRPAAHLKSIELPYPNHIHRNLAPPPRPQLHDHMLCPAGSY